MFAKMVNIFIALFTVSFTTTLFAQSREAQTMNHPIPGMEKCYGIAKMHQNDCSTSLHDCAGAATRSGDKTEWLLVPTGLCNKIVGGKISNS